jgi:N-formylglutamate amidohydrolase
MKEIQIKIEEKYRRLAVFFNREEDIEEIIKSLNTKKVEFEDFFEGESSMYVKLKVKKDAEEERIRANWNRFYREIHKVSKLSLQILTTDAQLSFKTLI